MKKKNGDFEKYKHHGNVVWVTKALKGKHRTACLCFRCSKFKPSNRDENCPIANLLYSVCVLQKLVTPVWECPDFIEGDPQL